MQTYPKPCFSTRGCVSSYFCPEASSQRLLLRRRFETFLIARECIELHSQNELSHQRISSCSGSRAGCCTCCSAPLTLLPDRKASYSACISNMCCTSVQTFCKYCTCGCYAMHCCEVAYPGVVPFLLINRLSGLSNKCTKTHNGRCPAPFKQALHKNSYWAN